MENPGGQYYWTKRIIAVGYPYIIIQALCYWTNHTLDLSVFLKDVLLLSPRYPYGWYLRYLAMWYIVFYVTMSVKLHRKYKLYVMATISMVLFFVEPELQAEQSFSFFTGVLLADSEKARKLVFNPKIGCAAIALASAFLAIKQLSIVRSAPQDVFNLVQLLIKLPCALGICSVTDYLLKKMNLLYYSYIGAISFEVYLLHGYLLQIFHDTAFDSVAFLLSTLVLSLLLHIFLSKTQRRMKSMLNS